MLLLHDVAISVTAAMSSSANHALRTPDQHAQKDEKRCDPSQDQELATFAGVDADGFTMLVDGIGGLDSDGRDDGAGDTNGKQGECGKQDIDKSGQSAVEEDRSECEKSRNADDPDADAVEDEGSTLSDV